MLTVKDRKIYSEKGVFLKTINCPKNVSNDSLIRKSDKLLLCSNCKKDIVDTDYVSEKELINLLMKDKNTCLKINRFNPMFRFE